jgi:hypothetical protein
MVELGDLVVYRVVERLSDFKPVDGKLYRVFKSKQDMQSSLVVPTYRGINGRLKKCKTEFVLRF